MTVSTTTSSLTYQCDGMTTAFAIPYPFLVNSHITAIKTDNTTGIQTTLVQDVDYTLVGAGVSTGGTLTTLSVLASNFKLQIKRVVPVTQLIDYIANDPFPAETHEKGLDQLTMICQQLAQAIADALSLINGTYIDTTVDPTLVLQLGPTRYLIPIKTIANTVQTVNKTYEGSLSLCTNAAPVAVTVRAITGDTAQDFTTGCFMSFKQVTSGGQVSLLPDAGVTLNLPYGYLAKTRGLNSIITATCEFSGSNIWTLSGDLAVDPAIASLIPQNSQSANYPLVLADAGKHILHPSADTTARTFTVPANSSVAFPIGTTITIVNQNAAGIVTIAITTDTMRLSAGGATGSRSLASNGIATLLKLTATEWIINGTGLS